MWPWRPSSGSGLQRLTWVARTCPAAPYGAGGSCCPGSGRTRCRRPPRRGPGGRGGHSSSGQRPTRAAVPCLVGCSSPRQNRPDPRASRSAASPGWCRHSTGKARLRAPGEAPRQRVPGLVEPLTGRELEVLGMLAVGTPNQRIAEELVITLDTVKSTSAMSSQARRGQPHRRCRPSTGTRPDLLAERRSPIRWHLRARTPPRKIPPIRYTFG
jgi:hypothetical protein